MRCGLLLQNSGRRAIALLFSFVCGGMLSVTAADDEDGKPLFGFAIRSTALEKRFSRQRNEQEPVSKFLMNSTVSGCQTTVTHTHLRIIPDDRSLRFEMLNSGDVTSQTTGINAQALVDSVGKHHFEITKPFWFDGSIFLTRRSHGTIQASQTPQRVVSAAGAAMPLLSPLSDRVAWDEVLRRQPEINQVVAEDVSRDVLPKIDRITENDFVRLGREWKSVQQQASAAFGGTMLKWEARSTDTVATVWAHSQPPGGRPDSAIPAPVPDVAALASAKEEIVVFVSDTAVGTLLAGYFPARIRLTDTQLQQLQAAADDKNREGRLSIGQFRKRLAEMASVDPSSSGLFTIEFAPKDPVEVRFVGGDVRVTVTFQIQPKLTAPSGWMKTSFNLRGTRLSEDSWTIAVRGVDVGTAAFDSPGIASGTRPEDRPLLTIPNDEQKAEESDVTTVQAGTAWIPIVRATATSLAEKFPPVTLPLEIDGSMIAADLPRLRISRIDSANGMLRVALRVIDAAEGLPLQ